jgi:hypothetical protein
MQDFNLILRLSVLALVLLLPSSSLTSGSVETQPEDSSVVANQRASATAANAEITAESGLPKDAKEESSQQTEDAPVELPPGHPPIRKLKPGTKCPMRKIVEIGTGVGLNPGIVSYIWAFVYPWTTLQKIIVAVALGIVFGLWRNSRASEPTTRK